MKSISLAFAGVFSALVASSLFAAPSGFPKQAIIGAVNDANLTVLAGNTRPEAVVANDQGAVEGSTPMQHMLLQLKRTPEREAALTELIDDLHNPQSDSYHQWLTPQQFAAHYGVAGEDSATVTRWLQSNGLTVNGVTPGGSTPAPLETDPAIVTELRPLGSFATWQAERAVGDHDRNTLRLRLEPEGGASGSAQLQVRPRWRRQVRHHRYFRFHKK